MNFVQRLGTTFHVSLTCGPYFDLNNKMTARFSEFCNTRQRIRRQQSRRHSQTETNKHTPQNGNKVIGVCCYTMNDRDFDILDISIRTRAIDGIWNVLQLKQAWRIPLFYCKFCLTARTIKTIVCYVLSSLFIASCTNIIMTRRQSN